MRHAGLREDPFTLKHWQHGPPCPSWFRLVLWYGPVDALGRLEAGIASAEAYADSARGPGERRAWEAVAAQIRGDTLALVDAFA